MTEIIRRQVPIEDITIENRHRRDLGDLEGLASSIAKHGQLQPIGLTSELQLIWGERRIRALGMMGVVDVDAYVGDFASPTAELEFAENMDRKAFTPVEMVAIGGELEKIESAKAKARMANRSDKLPDREKGDTRDKVAAKFGVSGSTYEHARAVVEAADKDPDRYGRLVDEMNRTGKVASSYNKLRRSRDEDRILNVEPVAGKFHTLVIDPPWKDDTQSEKGLSTLGYALMGIEQIEDLDPKQWAADEFCHFYVWCPNNFVAELCRIATVHWGLTYRNILHWVKPGLGTGHYTRNSTEQCLIFTCGATKVTRVNDQKNEFYAPKGGHSEKPDKFYEIVERLSYPPFGEVFQREEREDWINCYKEKDNDGDNSDR